MDMILIGPAGKATGLVARNAVSDGKIDITGADDGFSINRGPAPGTVGVLATAGMKPLISIHVHGNLSCHEGDCNPSTDPYSIPSIASLKFLDGARKAANDYLDGIESIVKKVRMKNEGEKKVKGVKSMELLMKGKELKATIGDGSPEKITGAFIDSLVVKKVDVLPGHDGTRVMMEDATCGMMKEAPGFPTKNVILCSDSVDQASIYGLKSYFPVYKEQLQSARDIKLASFAMKTRRATVRFSSATKCQIVNGTVCCKQYDDDEMTCY
jgi:hypothetical protein